MLLVDRLHNYFEQEFDLSDMDSKKLRYSLEFLYNDFSKTILLFILFAALGYPIDFIYVGIILFTLRIFTGGLHFKTYGGCLVFSLVFFVVAIYFKNSFSLTEPIIILIYVFSCLTIVGFAPITSKTRPKYSSSKKRTFKILGLMVLTIYFVLNSFLNTHLYLIYGVWVMVLQSIQILIAKGVEKK